MSSSTQRLVVLNAQATTLVFILHVLFPYQFYALYVSKLVSEWTGLPHVTLQPENSPAHALVVALNATAVMHLWMAARSTRKHAHASTALMQLIYGTIAIGSCTPLFPHQYGSSISLVGGLASSTFGLAICWVGGIGFKDMMGLFGGDESIRNSDRIGLKSS